LCVHFFVARNCGQSGTHFSDVGTIFLRLEFCVLVNLLLVLFEIFHGSQDTVQDTKEIIVVGIFARSLLEDVLVSEGHDAPLVFAVKLVLLREDGSELVQGCEACIHSLIDFCSVIALLFRRGDLLFEFFNTLQCRIKTAKSFFVLGNYGFDLFFLRIQLALEVSLGTLSLFNEALDRACSFCGKFKIQAFSPGMTGTPSKPPYSLELALPSMLTEPSGTIGTVKVVRSISDQGPSAVTSKFNT